MEKFCNFEHSHPIGMNSIRASNRVLIQYYDQLNMDEQQFIKQYGPVMLGIPKVRDILRLEFPDREFDGQLLSRLLRKGFTEYYGNDGDCMKMFLELGEKIRKDGGIFRLQVSQDTRISDIFIMKPSMQKYCEQFGDFVISDGTQYVDKYGLIAIFNTLVDSLGKSVISCYSHIRPNILSTYPRRLTYLGWDDKDQR